MSSTKIDSDALAKTVLKELDNYSQEVVDMVKREIKAVAKETVTELKTTSPKETSAQAKLKKRNGKTKIRKQGTYAKSWASKQVKNKKTQFSTVVYSKSPEYRLTHLLEFGHELVVHGKTVGHVEGKPHIRPAEQHAEENIINRIKNNL